MRAKKAYLRGADRGINDSKEAREELDEDLADAFEEILSGGSEEDLMEANRIQAWLEGKEALEIPPPEDWEIISSESEAKERELWSPYRPVTGVEIHPVLSFQSESEISLRWISYETGEEEWDVSFHKGTFPGSKWRPSDRFVFRDKENGTFIATIIVGLKDVELVLRDSPGGGVKVSFVVPAPKQGPFRPWPVSMPAVKKVQEDLQAACEEMSASRTKLKGPLIERLNEVLKVVMQSGDLPESNRINEFIEELKENDEMVLDDPDRWGLTLTDARAHIEAYFLEVDEISRLPSTTRLALVTKLEKARHDVMKKGGPSALQTANRIQETIRELGESESLCDSVLDAAAMAVEISLVKMLKRYKARGVALKNQRPLSDALDWLAEHQDPDGKWDTGDFMKHDPASDKCDGPGQSEHDVGVTGLVLLAFLKCGTDEHSTHGEAMINGGLWLTSQQDKKGLIGEKVGHTYLYDHAIATVALCDLYAITGNTVLGESAQRAVKYACLSRNQYGAWRYESPPNRENDTSVTAWMVTAIHSARRTGLEVDEAAFEGALRWIDHATERASGRIGYNGEGTASARVPGVNDHYPTDRTETMTAAGLHCRFLLGQVPSKDPIMVKHADLLMKSLPEWDPDDPSNDMYYWRWGSTAMSLVGGKKYWPNWQKAMKKAALDSQRKDGSSNGSWDPIGPWGYAGGRVYATAMMTSTLAVVLQ